MLLQAPHPRHRVLTQTSLSGCWTGILPPSTTSAQTTPQASRLTRLSWPPGHTPKGPFDSEVPRRCSGHAHGPCRLIFLQHPQLRHRRCWSHHPNRNLNFALDILLAQPLLRTSRGKFTSSHLSSRRLISTASPRGLRALPCLSTSCLRGFLPKLFLAQWPGRFFMQT